MTDKKCYICNKPIKRAPSLCRGKVLFCNHKCYSEYKRIKWKKDNPRKSEGIKEYSCKNCGKYFKRRGHGKNINSKNKFCSISCSAKFRGRNSLRENHWNFKGEGGRITKPIRGLAKYEKWRMSVFKRDSFKCTECHSDKDLQAHHIEELAKIVTKYIKNFGKLNVYDNIFYEVNNGLTLCKKCHKKIHKLQ